MIEVQQTITTHPGGNCFNACIASIFELDIDALPKFTDNDGYLNNEWMKFLSDNNLGMIYNRFPKPFATKNHDTEYAVHGYGIVIAQSPRFDCSHAVVYKDGEFLYDPHPQREVGVGEHHAYIMFYSLDPALDMEARRIKYIHENYPD